MNRKLAIIIALQALLIIMLFWVLVFYGKDEYEAYNQSQEQEIESPQHVVEKQGQSVVNVPAAAQKNSQISTEKLSSTDHQTNMTYYGTVVSIDALIDAKAKLTAAKAEADLAHAGTQTNLQDYQRLKLLNDDNKNVSDRAVQNAETLVKADLAKIKSADTNIQTIKKTIELQWGDTLAKLVTDNKLPAHLAALLTRKNSLVQISLPADSIAPTEGTTINLQNMSSAEPVTATYVSPALLSDSTNSGATYYFSAPAQHLRIGMRVKSQTISNEKNQTQGVVIPNSALVWYGGKSWVYVKQNAENFVRKPVSADNEVTGGWFNATGFKADDEVVVSGAQLLLSEEFKYQIKNENED